MAEYQFVTRWEMAAPIETVWEAIVDSKMWPSWWPAVQSVEDVSPGEPDGIGHVRRYVWKMPMAYQLAFNTRIVKLQAPHLLEAEAIGDVEGNGLWQLSSTQAGTEVLYTWTVRTTQPWMNALAKVARPLLEWNHNAVMNQGGQGLAAYLKVDVLNMVNS